VSHPFNLGCSPAALGRVDSVSISFHKAEDGGDSGNGVGSLAMIWLGSMLEVNMEVSVWETAKFAVGVWCGGRGLHVVETVGPKKDVFEK